MEDSATECSPEVSAPDADNKANRAAPYAAVIYFHGIGQQRHYESIGELVDRLDDWVYGRYRDKHPYFRDPRLRGVRNVEEPYRGSGCSKRNVVFIEVRYGPKDPHLGSWHRVRFYEGYWAPETVGGETAQEVLLWLVQQVAQPLRLLAAPWRKYERIRRGDLLRYYYCRRKQQSDTSLRNDVRRLVALYHAFQDVGAAPRYGFGNGSFRQFIRFIETREKARERRAQLVNLAKTWKRQHLRQQLKQILSIGSLLLATITSLLLLTAIVYMGLKALANVVLERMDWADFEVLRQHLAPNPLNVATVLALLISLLGVKRFLRDYIGDVKQFVTYEEIEPKYERRKRILDAAVSQLRHVLADPACRYVVVVGHSLGTAVALDAMLELRRYNRARNPSNPLIAPISLNKLQYFVTLGSPIDKINYFFSTHQSAYYAYKRIVERLRGDISEIPFSQTGRQPWIHWLNYWDRGDPISGPIVTVTGSDLSEQEVDNVQVSTYAMPDPIGSHGAYLLHNKILEDLFEIAFRGRYSFAHPPRDDRKRPQREWRGPGHDSALQKALLCLLPLVSLVLPWVLVELIAGWVGIGQWVLIGLVVILGLGMLLQRNLFLRLPSK